MKRTDKDPCPQGTFILVVEARQKVRQIYSCTKMGSTAEEKVREGRSRVLLRLLSLLDVQVGMRGR